MKSEVIIRPIGYIRSDFKEKFGIPRQSLRAPSALCELVLLPDFQSEEHIKAWLIRVTLNCSKSIFTTSWHKKTVPLSEREDMPVFDTNEKSDVYYAVAELPQKYRAVIHLFYYEDMSVEQISKYLKANPSTVKSQLSRGRKMLGEKLKGGYDFV